MSGDHSSTKAATRLVNVPFAVIVLSVTIMNMPYLDPEIVPGHDTMDQFEMFRFFYSESLIHGDLARWIPYGTYGVPSAMHLLRGVTPPAYFLGLIGSLFGIGDVLLLWKLSVFLQQLILAVGTYLLSTVLFTHRTTVFLVCFATTASTVWLTQIYLNLHLIYLVPLVLYFLVSFFEKNRPERLWLAGISAVLSLLGSGTYPPLYAFVFGIVFAVFAFRNPTTLTRLFSLSWKNLFTCAFFWLCAIVIGYLAYHSLDFLAVLRTGRENWHVTLTDFLTAGSDMIRSFRFPEFISGMKIHHHPIAVYVGVLPLFFFGLSLVTVRKVPYIAMATAAGALIWLSVGGLFAIGVYCLPGMSLVRNIGHFYSLVKLLIIVCAGFGLDHFLDTISDDKRFQGLKQYRIFQWNTSRIHVLGSVVVCLFLVDCFAAYHFHNFTTEYTTWVDICSGGLFAARVFVYLAVGWSIYKRIRGSAVPSEEMVRRITFPLILCFVFDLSSFQLMAYFSTPKIPAALRPSASVLRADGLHFQGERSNEPQSESQQKRLELLLRDYPYRNTKSELAYSFIQMDPCIPRFSTILFPMGVRHLINLRGGQVNESPSASYLPTDDPALLRVLGCGSPKLRLVSCALLAETAEEAGKIIARTQELDRVAVLRRHVEAPPDLAGIRGLGRWSVEVDSDDGRSFVGLKAADKNADTFWETSKPLPHWIQFELPSQREIGTYALQTGQHGLDSTERMPKTWYFQASNDGAEWITLDSRSKEIGWQPGEKRVYCTARGGAYRYYRLFVTAVVNSDVMRLYEVDFQSVASSNDDARVGSRSSISVTYFSANRLDAIVEAEAPGGTWLVYADAYHPAWQATVNGKAAEIFEAYLAFKAVELQNGRNAVRFWFDDGARSILPLFLVLVSIVFTVILLAMLVRILCNKPPDLSL